MYLEILLHSLRCSGFGCWITGPITSVGCYRGPRFPVCTLRDMPLYGDWVPGLQAPEQEELCRSVGQLCA